jgi:predicted outer membrane repeat protein
MRKITILTICFIIIILGGCQNIFTGKSHGHRRGETLPDGYGALQVSFAHGAARTAMPYMSLDEFDLEFIFTREGAGEERQEPESNGGIYTFTLPAGEYKLVVKAWQKDLEKTEASLIAEGSADIAITAGQTKTYITVTLYPKIPEDGIGTLKFKLSYNGQGNANVKPGAFTLSPIFGDARQIDVLELPELVDEEFMMGEPYSVLVSAGYYLLSVTLVKTPEDSQNAPSTSYFANKSEVVHIYRNMETIIDYDFTDIIFIENIVTNTLDYYENDEPIPGSLRYALEKASKLAVKKTTVRVMLPQGSEIKLKRCLYIENNAELTIEGSGIILSKNAEWENIPNEPLYNSLMTISGSDSQPSTTIRRIHFKDSDDSAIQNNGSLSLESCIFSNNVGGIDGIGGAIITCGTLTLKGCTFYNNYAVLFGGAIANDGTIYLAGNLFFENKTDFTHPVIYPDIYNNTSKVISGGYNAVDVEIGIDDDNQSRWTKDDSDIEINPTMCLSPKTFKLFSNSTAKGIINKLPDNYPKFDFYGNEIKAPAAAGAVQGTIDGGYYLDLDSGNGRVTVWPACEDFIYPIGATVTLTANPLTGGEFKGWQVEGTTTPNKNNPLTLTMDGDKQVKAIFTIPPVNSLEDNDGSMTKMTLRYALTIAEDDDEIRFEEGLVNPGKSEINLVRPLPAITKSITIEGGGITLKPAYNTAYTMMAIVNTNIKISRVHFKGGESYTGGAISNKGILTLESCIFSNNTATYYGGAIITDGTLIVKGCTFYNNYADSSGGAIENEGTIELTGNLFFGNKTDSTYPVIHSTEEVISGGYNAVDVDFGTDDEQSGWMAGTEDQNYTTTITGAPFNTYTFAPVSALQGFIPDAALTDFPKTDFNGNDRKWPGAPGAVNYED